MSELLTIIGYDGIAPIFKAPKGFKAPEKSPIQQEQKQQIVQTTSITEIETTTSKSDSDLEIKEATTAKTKSQKQETQKSTTADSLALINLQKQQDTNPVQETEAKVIESPDFKKLISFRTSNKYQININTRNMANTMDSVSNKTNKALCDLLTKPKFEVEEHISLFNQIKDMITSETISDVYGIEAELDEGIETINYLLESKGESDFADLVEMCKEDIKNLYLDIQKNNQYNDQILSTEQKQSAPKLVKASVSQNDVKPANISKGSLDNISFANSDKISFKVSQGFISDLESNTYKNGSIHT